MAEKKVDLDPVDDIDSEIDRLLNDDPTDFGTVKDDRKPVVKALKAGYRGIKDSVLDPSYIGKIAKEALPSEYVYTFDEVNKVKTDLRTSYQDSVRELGPNTHALINQIDKLIPPERKKTKTRIERIKKLLGITDVEEQRSQNKEDEVESTLNSIFGDPKETAEDRAENRIGRRIRDKRLSGIHETLGQIDQGIQRVVGYTENINRAFQKKSLEIQQRQYLASVESLRISKEYLSLYKTTSEQIVKNTGLPDFIKLHDSERFAEMSKSRFIGKIQDTLFGTASPIVRSLGIIKAGIKNKIGSVRDFTQGASDTLDQLAESREMMKGLDVDKPDIYGAMAGGSLAGFLGSKLSEHLKGKYEKGGKIKRVGQQLGGRVSNITGTVEDILGSNRLMDWELKGGVRGAAAGGIRSLLEPLLTSGPALNIGGTYNLAQLGAPAHYDQQARRTIISVIPGYLSRIFRELQVIRTGDDTIELTQYDFKRDQFLGRSTLMKGFMTDLINTSSGGWRNYAVEQTLSGIKGETQLSPNAEKALKEIINSESFNKNNFSLEKLLQSDAFEKLPEEVKQELQPLLRGILEGDQDVKEKKNYEYIQRMQKLKSYIGDIRPSIDNLIQMGHRDDLLKSGVIREKNGIYVIDREVYQNFINGRGPESPSIVEPPGPRVQAEQVKPAPNRLGGIGRPPKPMVHWHSSITPDVYIKGDSSPLLSGIKFQKQEYYNQDNGKVIRSPREITGPVVDFHGRLVATAEDLSQPLVSHEGKPIPTRFRQLGRGRYQKGRRWRGRRNRGAESLYQDSLADTETQPASTQDQPEVTKVSPAQYLSGKGLSLKGSLEGIKQSLGVGADLFGRARDLYKDRLKKSTVATKVGGRVKGLFDRIKDSKGTARIGGLLSKANKLPGVGRVSRIAGGVFGKAKGLLGGLLSKTPEELSTSASGLMDKASGLFDPGFNRANAEDDSQEISNALNLGRGRNLSNYLKDNFEKYAKTGDIRHRVGNAFDRAKAQIERKAEIDRNRYQAHASTAPKYLSAQNVFEGLLKKVTSSMGMIGEGMSLLADLFGKGGGYVGKVMTWLRKGRLSGAVAGGGSLLRRVGGGLVRGAGTVLGAGARAAGALLPTVAGRYSRAGGRLARVGGGIAKTGLAVAKKALPVAGRALGTGARAIGGIASAGKLGAGGLAKAGAPIASALGAARNVGTVANIASKAAIARNVLLVGDLAMTGGMGAGIMTAAGVGLEAVAAVMASPVVLGALAIGAVGYGAYKLYKYLSRNRVTPLTKIRLRQYGLSEEHKGHYHQVIGLEAYLEDGKIGYQNGSPHLIQSKIKPKEIFELFDINPKNDRQTAQFLRWFNERFKPVYLTNVKAIRQVNPKVQLSDADRLTDDEKYRFINAASFEGGPYATVASPFPDFEILTANGEDVHRAIDFVKGQLSIPDKIKEGDGVKSRKLQPWDSYRQSDDKRIKDKIKELDTEYAKFNQGQVPGKKGPLAGFVEGLASGLTVGASDSYFNRRKASPVPLFTGAMTPELLKAADKEFRKYNTPGGRSEMEEARTMPWDSYKQGKAIDMKAPNQEWMKSRAQDGLLKGVDLTTTDVSQGKNFKVTGSARLHDIHKVDPRLVNAVRLAAANFPYPVHLISGLRPGDHRFHGKGMAVDVEIINPQTGKKFPNYQNAFSFRTYEDFAQRVKMIQSTLYPDLNQRLRWGGYFSGPRGKYGALDTMHFDIGGSSHLGMSGGSWESGLSPTMRKIWRGAESLGMQKGWETIQAKNQASNDKVLNIEDQAVKSGTEDMAGPQQGSKAPTLAMNVTTTPEPEAAPMATGGGFLGSVTGVTGTPTGGTPSEVATKQILAKKGIGGEVGQLKLGNGVMGVVNMLDQVGQMTGVDPGLLKSIAAVESGFKPNAGAKSSSAKGLFQFINSTWAATVRKYGKKYGITPGTSVYDPKANALMGAEYVKENMNIIKSVKPNLTATDLYMAHFLGGGGARQFLATLSRNPGANAASLFPEFANNNKSIFYSGGKSRSLGELYSFLDDRVRTRAGQFGVDTGGKPPPMLAMNQASPLSEPAMDEDKAYPRLSKGPDLVTGSGYSAGIIQEHQIVNNQSPSLTSHGPPVETPINQNREILGLDKLERPLTSIERVLLDSYKIQIQILKAMDKPQNKAIEPPSREEKSLASTEETVSNSGFKFNRGPTVRSKPIAIEPPPVSLSRNRG